MILLPSAALDRRFGEARFAPVTQHSRNTPQFYLTAPSPCPYLASREERKVFTHLVGERAPELNDLLTHGGFRRSQSIAYRPACEVPRLRLGAGPGRRIPTVAEACGASCSAMRT